MGSGERESIKGWQSANSHPQFTRETRSISGELRSCPDVTYNSLVSPPPRNRFVEIR